MTVVVERQEEQTQVRSTRHNPLGLVALALVVACGVIVVGAVASTDPEELEPTQLLTTNEDGTVSLLDAETGEWVYDVPNARIATDRSVIYQARSDGVKTVVAEMRATDAAETWSQQLPGDLQVRVVSPQGGAVALMDSRPNRGLYVPEPREVTEIIVAWTDGAPWRQYRLDGNFEPEAFSLSGETLFLLEFLPANNPTSYEVARLDLESGFLMEHYTPSLEAEPWMRGHARQQVMAPDGRYLYTLYSIDYGEDKIQSDDPTNPTLHNAFVHVIDLEEEGSVCIFLPRSFSGLGGNVGLAVSPDGSKLLAVDYVMGVMIDIDPATHTIAAVHGNGPRVPGATSHIAVDNTGRAFLSFDGNVLLDHGRRAEQRLDPLGCRVGALSRSEQRRPLSPGGLEELGAGGRP